ncbi:MAG TPA: hypothetical protein VNG89_17735, partial [Vicinamibacterales bacterium]|nr:hypothetical protein [Vicinamibacterales bacterium]
MTRHVVAITGASAGIGGEPLPIVADVTREADMERFVAAAVERFGRFFDVMSHETGTAVTRAYRPRQSVETVADAIARA